MTSSSSRRAERGMILIHAILFVALITSTATLLASVALSRAAAVRLRCDRVQAFHAAEAGLAVAASDRHAGVVEGKVGGATYRVVSLPHPDGGVRFISTGRCGAAEATVAAERASPGGALAAWERVR